MSGFQHTREIREMCSQVPSLLGPAGARVADSRPNVWASWAVGALNTEPGDSLLARESFSVPGCPGRATFPESWLDDGEEPRSGHTLQLVLIGQRCSHRPPRI